jgi:hypothetical protein
MSSEPPGGSGRHCRGVVCSRPPGAGFRGTPDWGGGSVEEEGVDDDEEGICGLGVTAKLTLQNCQDAMSV